MIYAWLPDPAEFKRVVFGDASAHKELFVECKSPEANSSPTFSKEFTEVGLLEPELTAKEASRLLLEAKVSLVVVTSTVIVCNPKSRDN